MSRRHGDFISPNTVYDVIVENTIHDLLGDGGDLGANNLELEDGNDYLLEDGCFILLE